MQSTWACHSCLPIDYHCCYYTRYIITATNQYSPFMLQCILADVATILLKITFNNLFHDIKCHEFNYSM